MFNFKEKKKPKSIAYAWGKELIDEGMRFYVGEYTWLAEYSEIVSWLSNNKNKGLFCVGDFGLGKTVICTLVLPAVFDEWKWDYISVSAYEMARKVDEIKKHEIIIIDDIGVEGESVIYGEHRQIFNEIVDFAEKEGCLLIITSNLGTKELQKKYGVRTFDRLRQITKAIVFQGKSLRGQTESETEKSYAYGLCFDTEEEADAFAEEQMAIRKGVDDGTLFLYDKAARDAFEMNEALETRGADVFKYGEKEG